jgi:hypothetical protein
VWKNAQVRFGVEFQYPLGSSLALQLIAALQQNAPALRDKYARRFVTDAGVGSGNDKDLSGLIWDVDLSEIRDGLRHCYPLRSVMYRQPPSSHENLSVRKTA